MALQEVDKHCTRSGNIDMAARLAERLGMAYVFGKAMDFQGGEYGLAVLSRLPILETSLHRLPAGDEPRRALEVTIRVGHHPEPVSFISIHNSWTGEEIRVKQVAELLKSIGERDHPVVLAGDFNARRGSDSMKLLDQSGWRILDTQSAGTVISNWPASQIDFFVIRGFSQVSVESRVIDETVASDHRPIVAEIIFQKDG